MAQFSKEVKLRDKVAEIHRQYWRWHDYWKNFIDRSIEAIKFYGGDQWDAEDLAMFQDQNRPIVTINRIAPLVRQVTGMRTKERIQPRVVPEREGTVEMANIYTKLLYFILKKSNYQAVNHNVQEDQVVTGRGWWEVFVNYEDDPRGELDITDAEWNEVLPDPNAREAYYEDGEAMLRVRWLSKKALMDLDIKGAEDLPDEPNNIGFRDNDDWRTRDLHSQFHDGNGNYEVIQRFTIRKVKKIEITDGETFREIPERFPDEVVRGMFGDLAAQTETMEKQVWVETVVPVIDPELPVDESPYDVQVGMYPFIPALCYVAGSKIMGIVEDLKDEQRRTNKSFSQIIEILGYSAKGLWLVPKNSVEPKQFEKNSARPGGMVEYAGNQVPQYVETARLPQGYAQIYDASEKNFQLISGIVPALEGKSEFAGESGVKFAQKLQQAREQLAVIDRRFTDGFTRVCRMIMLAIPQIYDYEFVFTALEGKDNYVDVGVNVQSETGQILNDITRDTGIYDLNIEQSQETSTIRQASLEEMSKVMAQIGPQFASLLIAEWVRGTDIENKEQLAERIELLSGQAMQLEVAKSQVAAANQQAGQQASQAKQQQESVKTATDVAKTRAEIEQMEADTQRKDAEADAKNLKTMSELLYSGAAAPTTRSLG